MTRALPVRWMSNYHSMSCLFTTTKVIYTEYFRLACLAVYSGVEEHYKKYSTLMRIDVIYYGVSVGLKLELITLKCFCDGVLLKAC